MFFKKPNQPLPPKPAAKPSLLGALAGVVVNGGSAALEGYAQVHGASAGGGGGRGRSKPGCTPCAAMARRQRASAYVGSLKR